MNISHCVLIFALAITPIASALSAEQNTAVTSGSAKLSSAVFKWEELKVKPTEVGERRDVANNPTSTLQVFESHASTLNPGKASHLPHTHPQEEIIILREGILEVMVNGATQKAGAGSVIFFASGNPHAVRNIGDKPANYTVFNFTTAATLALKGQPSPAPVEGRLGSSVFEWEKLSPKSTAVGERREITNLPTATLNNLECHVTTLRPGQMAHAPHHHPDEEIILVKEGLLDATINGHTQRAGVGSVLFYASNDEHGMKNVGDAMATYYVLRVVTAATLAAK